MQPTVKDKEEGGDGVPLPAGGVLDGGGACDGGVGVQVLQQRGE